MVKITEKSAGNVTIVSMEGKIDSSSSVEIEKRINVLIERGSKYLIINFSSIDYISSSGLRVMLSSLKRLRKVQGDLKLSCMQPSVRQVFNMAGFTQIFELYEKEEEAVSRFNSHGA